MDRRGFLRLALGAGAVLMAGSATARLWPTAAPSPAAPTRGAGTAPPDPASPSPAPAVAGASAVSLPSLPGSQAPIFAPSLLSEGRAAGLLFLTPEELRGVICEDDGNAVWMRSPTAPATALGNLSVGSYAGQPVLSWWEGLQTGGHGQGEFVLVDETYQEVARVRAGNGLAADVHELVLTDRGTALLMAYVEPASPMKRNGAAPILDCVVQEIDVGTGAVLFEWRASAHVPPDESFFPLPKGDLAYDYFHANSIDEDTDGNLILSARNTCAVYKIDRSTGAVIWRLGGKRSDFAMGPGTSFAWQHDARRHAGGLLTLFDDGTAGQTPPIQPDEPQSRGVVLELDETAGTATLVREYAHLPAILAPSQGNLQMLPNGNALVGWGAEPALTEFDAAGAVRLDGRLRDKVFSYRALRHEWHGRPTQPPFVSFELYSQTTAVRVSWNGATDVDAWRVLGGDSPASLAVLGSARRMGFETIVHVPGRPGFIAVEAIDRTGAALGRSVPQPT